MLTVCTSAITSFYFLRHQTSEGPLTPRNIIGVVFFSSCFYIAVGQIVLNDFMNIILVLLQIMFFNITMKWKMLMITWMKTESFLMSDNYELPASKLSLKRRVLICATIYWILSFLEHVFYQSSEMYRLYKEIEVCNSTHTNLAEIFITRHLSFIFKYLPFGYNHILGVALEYLNVSYTFYWNFLDLFIILLSIGIAFLYEKINFRLKSMRGLSVNDSLWEEIRFHHVQISELTKIVNENINEMIITSCFIDGYFR